MPCFYSTAITRDHSGKINYYSRRFLRLEMGVFWCFGFFNNFPPSWDKEPISKEENGAPFSIFSFFRSEQKSAWWSKLKMEKVWNRQTTSTKTADIWTIIVKWDVAICRQSVTHHTTCSFECARWCWQSTNSSNCSLRTAFYHSVHHHFTTLRQGNTILASPPVLQSVQIEKKSPSQKAIGWYETGGKRNCHHPQVQLKMAKSKLKASIAVRGTSVVYFVQQGTRRGM